MLKSSFIQKVRAVLLQSRVRGDVRRRKVMKSEQLETRALLSAGTLDTTFDTDGIVTTPMSSLNDEAWAVAVQADGKTVAAGPVYTAAGTEFGIARYNVNGSLDTSFDLDGKVSVQINQFSCIPYSVAMQADGKIVVAGWTSNGSNIDTAMVRLLPDGSLDTSFGTGGKVITPVGSGDDNANKVVIQPDGKILLGGETMIGGQRDSAILRYEANGALDTTFATGGIFTRGLFGSTPDGVSGLALQPDGKIVASGFIPTSGTYWPSLLRLNSNGTLDGTLNGDGFTFHSFSGIGMLSGNVTVLPDGDILVGGVAFSGGRNNFAAIRYNDNGSLDSTFDGDGLLVSPIRPYSDSASQIFARPDGKFYLGGTSYSTTDQDFALARYNSNGTLDSTFGTNGVTTTSIGSGDDIVSAMAVGPDGKIVLAGGTYNGGNSDFAVARYLGSNIPTSLLISSTQVVEGSPVATAVGTFSTVDSDAGETFTYSLVSGAGSTDNASFVIDGNVLKTNAVFDSTVKSSYSIRVHTTDNNGLSLEKTIALTVREGLRVYSTSISEDGTLPVGSIRIHLTFNIAMQNANVTANYGLQRAGSDGLLTTSDPVVKPTSVIVRGQVVVLTFASMVEDSYRLIIRDEILDSGGFPLDGNADRLPGGDSTTDFVVDSGVPMIDLVSEIAVPTQNQSLANQSSSDASVSSDGRYVAFRSLSTNLTTFDTNVWSDIFVKDLQTGRVTLVSTGASSQGDGHSQSPSISSDGRFVAFEKLFSAPHASRKDVFVKDLQTGALTLVSAGASGPGNSFSESPSISSNGRFVAFQSAASNLVSGDTNGLSDVFVKDLQTGTVTLVSTATSGEEDHASFSPSISSDGRFVAFESALPNLASGDTNEYSDIFVKDLQTGVMTSVSIGATGLGYVQPSFPSISGDGRFLVFQSIASNLVSGDTNGKTDIFVKDLQTGTITLVSTAASSQGNGNSASSSISSDGQLVAFQSLASNLVSGDTNGTIDTFVKDLQTGTVTLVSTATSGQANGYSYRPSISGDGRFVAFESDASNLVNGDTNGKSDIFVKDLTTSTVSLATIPDTQNRNLNANKPSQNSSISSDGRYVAFESDASNLVSNNNNGRSDIFMKDRQTGTVMLVSTAVSGQGNGYSYRPSISGDGRFVAFQSDASNLVNGDTNGYSDIFVKDLQTGAMTPVSTGATGPGYVQSSSPSISSDGRFVVFQSNASNLVSGDTNGLNDIFVKDLLTGSLTLVSTGASGQGNDSSGSPSISSDGRFVAFGSFASNLVSGDTNGLYDAFVKDLQTGTVTLVSTGASGQGNGSSGSPSISSDGRFVAFASAASNLVSGDTNGNRDIFVKDLQTGTLTLVSAGASGPGNSDAFFSSISGDGRFVVFRSKASNLVSGDDTISIDVFVKDVQTGALTRLPTWASTENYDESPSISSDGRFISFASNLSSLVSGDANSERDVFVAVNPLAGAPLLPVSLTAPNTHTFLVDRAGVGTGQLLSGTNGTFDGLNRLQINGTDFSVPANSSASTQDGGQTVVSASNTFAGLSVLREVTVPATGSQSFARTVEVFTNSTSSGITVPVRLFGNLGSDGATAVFMTSDGDTIVEATDWWIATDDANASGGTPAVLHLLRNPFGITPTSIKAVEDNVDWTYSLTLAPGETKRIATFTVLGQTRQQVLDSVAGLIGPAGFIGQATQFLSVQEIGSLQNFRFNLAPTAVALTNVVSSLDDFVSVANQIRVADINVTDDAVGTNSLSLSGPDAAFFEIIASKVYLKAGTVLDAISKPSFSFTISVRDSSVVGSNPKTVNGSLSVTTKVPTITGPSSSTIAMRPTLTWNAVAGVSNYQLLIRKFVPITVAAAGYVDVVVATTTNSYMPSVDLGIGQFSFFVRSVSVSGPTITSLSRYTAPYGFTVVTPVTVNPVSPVTQPTPRPTVTWQPLPGAASYRVRVYDITNGTTTATGMTVAVPPTAPVPGTSWIHTADLPIGKYRIGIQGVDANGVAGNWSVERYFVVAPAPVLTQVTSTFSTRPTFRWATVSGATKYEITVTKSGSTSTIVVQQFTSTNLYQISTTAPALTAGYYSWKVRAIRTVGTTQIASAFSVSSTIYIGGRPLANAPVVASGIPTFSWLAVQGAATYQIRVERIHPTNGTTIETNVIGVSGLTGTSRTQTSPLAAGTYRFWVRAISTSPVTTSLWSSAVDFIVAESAVKNEFAGDTLELPFVLNSELPTAEDSALVASARIVSEARQYSRASQSESLTIVAAQRVAVVNPAAAFSASPVSVLESGTDEASTVHYEELIDVLLEKLSVDGMMI